MEEKFKPFTIDDYEINIPKISYDKIEMDNFPIIFDTNFLFVTFEFNIDVIAELKRLVSSNFTLYIYEGTISELKNIERKKEKNKKFLPLIMKMLTLYKFKIIKSNLNYIDDQILENINGKSLIATNDKELRNKIRKQGKKVLYMRNKSYLEIG
jgi:hypothetical protein